MQRILAITFGLVLFLAMFALLSAAPVRAERAGSVEQRATSTPTPRVTPTTTSTTTPTATLSIAHILAITPVTSLTTTTILTSSMLTTTILMPVQIVTASLFLSGTATVTPSVTITPLATSRATTRVTPSPTPMPTSTPGAANGTGIIDFRAVASRLRGRVDLSWGYDGATFGGDFLVERSTNGSVWRFVKDCVQPYDAAATAYKCSDIDLTSGTAYSYRACVVDYGTACSSKDVTEPVTVKAP